MADATRKNPSGKRRFDEMKYNRTAYDEGPATKKLKTQTESGINATLPNKPRLSMANDPAHKVWLKQFSFFKEVLSD